MDGAKSLARLIVAVGVISIGTAIGPVAWLRDAGSSAAMPDHGAIPSARTAPTLSWFEQAKPFCNGVEAKAHLRTNPYPGNWDGAAHGAACLALAGHLDDARRIIDGLEGEQRWRAAGVVFDVGHPAADAGDDMAAGPLMELVVEFWPNHYMALYHAGVARYERGDEPGGRDLLERFLRHYEIDDGFTRHAESLLGG